jgi:hypothetical protein
LSPPNCPAPPRSPPPTPLEQIRTTIDATLDKWYVPGARTAAEECRKQGRWPGKEPSPIG